MGSRRGPRGHGGDHGVTEGTTRSLIPTVMFYFLNWVDGKLVFITLSILFLYLKYFIKIYLLLKKVFKCKRMSFLRLSSSCIFKILFYFIFKIYLFIYFEARSLIGCPSWSAAVLSRLQ